MQTSRATPKLTSPSFVRLQDDIDRSGNAGKPRRFPRDFVPANVSGRAGTPEKEGALASITPGGPECFRALICSGGRPELPSERAGKLRPVTSGLNGRWTWKHEVEKALSVGVFLFPLTLSDTCDFCLPLEFLGVISRNKILEVVFRGSS